MHSPPRSGLRTNFRTLLGRHGSDLSCTDLAHLFAAKVQRPERDYHIASSAMTLCTHPDLQRERKAIATITLEAIGKTLDRKRDRTLTIALLHLIMALGPTAGKLLDRLHTAYQMEKDEDIKISISHTIAAVTASRVL